VCELPLICSSKPKYGKHLNKKARRNRGFQQPVHRPLGEMKLKSEIFRPTAYETLPPNHAYTVFGTAWSGKTEVTEVSVSIEGGQIWA